MKKMTGGQAAVEAIRAEGTSHVFGLIGSATMEMFDALYDADDIKFIGVHDERTGTHMADGFARMSGQAGVILSGAERPRCHQPCDWSGAGQGGLFAGGQYRGCIGQRAPLP